MTQQFSPMSMSNTKWRNPTSHPVRLQFYMGVGQPDMVAEIPPGDVGEVWSIFDEAVQRVKDGVIVGGLAPQLVREGTAPIPIHQALQQAIVLGELERNAARATGITGGARHLDMGMALQMQIDQLKVDMGQRLSDAESAAAEAFRRAEAEAARRAAAEEDAAKARAEADALASKKDQELEALRRQLEELQTAPVPTHTAHATPKRGGG